MKGSNTGAMRVHESLVTTLITRYPLRVPILISAHQEFYLEHSVHATQLEAVLAVLEPSPATES